MADISSLFPSKYLKAADISGELDLTITSIKVEEVGQDRDQRPVLYFSNESKGLVLNKTNANFIAHMHGSETDSWVGKEITLHTQPVAFQGKVVDSIRVKAA